jgi:hypothetical protein
MRTYQPLSVTTFVLLFGAAVFAVPQNQSAAELFRELQNPDTSTQAAGKLIQLANQDPETRRFVAKHIPVVIAASPIPADPQYGMMRRDWYNAVQIAADLKLAEAVPALAKWITFLTDTSRPFHASTLEDCPAGLALARIGDPAIPAVQHLLESGDTRHRWQAAYVLALIDSAKSQEVLRDYAVHGKDRLLASEYRYW